MYSIKYVLGICSFLYLFPFPLSSVHVIPIFF